MADAKAKTINLLLYEGDLEGVISIEDSSWNSGELYSAPRDSVSELLETDACKKYGVYLLLSKSMVYVGQSSDLSKRITQHTVGKDWWESVVILTTKDDSLTHSDIDYLESVLIDKAFKINRLDCDNKNKGNNPKVSKFQKVVLDQYLDEALFLMQLIGITVFSDKKSGTLINTIDTKTKLALGKRAKSDAVSYLEEKGITVGKKVTYAVKQQGKDEFWANPKKDLLGQEWWLILKLFLLSAPRMRSKAMSHPISSSLRNISVSEGHLSNWTRSETPSRQSCPMSSLPSRKTVRPSPISQTSHWLSPMPRSATSCLSVRKTVAGLTLFREVREIRSVQVNTSQINSKQIFHKNKR